MSGYPIPADETQVELRFRNSRFIGTVGCASTVTAAREFVEALRARYPDASHHVYAFAVGYGAAVTHGMSDDGEPAGTAGRPTLAVLQGTDIGDTAVVTTRYFGGTRLGTGGLVRAYTVTAQQVLAAAPRTVRIALRRFRVALPYGQHAVCRRLMQDLGATIEAERFGAHVVLEGTCPEDTVEEVNSVLGNATSGRARLSLSG